MKRVMAVILALAVVLGLGGYALGETPPETDMEQALQGLTLAVKEALLVEDDYTEFYSDYYDGLWPRWTLNWSGDGRSLGVDVDLAGKIMNVYVWRDSESHDRFYGFDPAFPAVSPEDARAQGEMWLARLMGPGESGRIDSERAYLGSDGYYRFTGTVLINGLDSPITFAMEIGGEGLSYYYRSDEYGGYVGVIPRNLPAVDAKVGENGLFGAVLMDLRYVTDRDGTAKLRYVPVGPHTVVDAMTGEAVDMDGLYAELESAPAVRGGFGVETAAEVSADSGAAMYAAALTEVELSSIAGYGDVMDQRALDAALRAVAVLGLDGFELTRCSYAMDSATGDVTASLRYTAEMEADRLWGYSREEYDQYVSWGDRLTIYKYITVNAKTGALEEVSTNYPLWKTDESTWLGETVRQTAAEAFLGERAEFSQTALYEDGTYARVHEGYFYPENYLLVEINPAEGTVDTFRRVWDEDVVFAPAAGIVSEAEAKAAYAGALEVTLGYVAWPVDILAEDPIAYARFMEQGYSFVEMLRLGYYYGGTEDIQGVDALTGEAVRATENDAGTYEYTDLAGCPQGDMIRALGRAGIGFGGGTFQPEAVLTQRDAVVLLLQAGGYDLSGAEDETVLDRAVWLGLLGREDWAPAAEMTRMGLLRMVLGASRYGDAARLLSGSGSDAGYVAIAQALGMDTGSIGQVLTRADGAALLYGFMCR